jgi:heme exporter protein C
MKRMRILLKSVYLLMPASLTLAFLWSPPAEILGDASRILYIHVPLAWVSVLAFAISGIVSIIFLADRKRRFTILDDVSYNSAAIGLLFTVMAVTTGSIWARMSWGSFWNWDPRETSIIIVLLIYVAYFSLQAALVDMENKGRIGATYLIIAMMTLPFFVFLVPRIYESLHPATIINPERTVHLETRMRITLAASILSFSLLYGYLLSILNRVSALRKKIEEARHAKM